MVGIGRRSVQDAVRGVVGGQEGLDAFPQRVVGAAGAVQVGRAFGPGRFFQNRGEKSFFSIGGRHGSTPANRFLPVLPCAIQREIVPLKSKKISRPDAGCNFSSLKRL